MSKIDLYEEKPFWLELIEYILGLLALVGAIYFGSYIALKVIVDKTPEKFENVMVQMIDYNQYQTPFYYIKEEMVVQGIVDQLHKSLPNAPQFTVRIVDQQNRGLLSLPGGYLVLSSGLIKSLQSENELVFLLGHAMGHTYERHQLLALGRGSVWVYLSANLLGVKNGVTKSVASHFSFTDPVFTAKQEMTADQTALHLMRIKYGHAFGALEFMQRVKTDGENTTYKAFAAQHPLSTERFDELRNDILKSGVKAPQLTPLDPAFFSKFSS